MPDTTPEVGPLVLTQPEVVVHNVQKTDYSEIKRQLLDPRVISKGTDADGRDEATRSLIESRRAELAARAQLASGEALREEAWEGYRQRSALIREKEEDRDERREKFWIRLKAKLNIGDKKLNQLESDIATARNESDELKRKAFEHERVIEQIGQEQGSQLSSREVLKAYYEKVARTPLSVEEKRRYLTPDFLSSLSTEEYIALWRRLEPHFLTHVTRQGFRDHNAMVYHSAGLREFHNGFVSVLEDQMALRPPIAIEGLIDRSDDSILRIQQNWVLKAENEDEARERWNNLLNFSFGSAPSYPDKTAVHFAAELVADAYYGAESGNEVFFIFPADYLASQHKFTFNGNEKDFTHPQSETKWNDVFFWPKDQGDPKIDLNTGVVFLPKNTMVDPETGSKYASVIADKDGVEVRIMAENPGLEAAYMKWFRELTEESPARQAFAALKEEGDYFRQQDKRRLFYGVTSQSLVEIGVPEDTAIDLAGEVLSEFYIQREVPDEALNEHLHKSRAIWKRTENAIRAEEYWDNFFRNHSDLKPAHVVYYDGNPTRAILSFQRDNGIGNRSEGTEGQITEPLLGFESNFVADMSKDPLAFEGYQDLFDRGNQLIRDHFNGGDKLASEYTDGSKELPKISEAGRIEDDERLLSLVDKDTESGWRATMVTITDEIVGNPGWLLEGDVYDSSETDDNRKLLEYVRQNGLNSLDDLDGIRIDTKSRDAFVMRFLEIFSQKYNFPYVWRGGSLDELDNTIRGTYTFFIGEAEDNVMSSTYAGPRRNPGLIGLPVAAIIEDFKNKKGNINLIAEHGRDGIVSVSFDLFLSSEAPEGTLAYSPD